MALVDDIFLATPNDYTIYSYVDYSESVAATVDAEIRKLIERAHQEAYDMAAEGQELQAHIWSTLERQSE